ncbi:MAG: hypothetical protein EU532_04870 [Promethearchaeota archaeon]|nr:MAG: hypothetical protein EU532_04870 [Candidatus Lokiarchaeota archaeon]
MEDYKLTKEELEMLYEVLFRRIMEIMKNPDVDKDPFNELINRLSTLSTIFSFKSMISIIPELVAYAIRYGMMVEKAYQEEGLDLDEEIQEKDEAERQKMRLSRMKEDMDKINLYL